MINPLASRDNTKPILVLYSAALAEQNPSGVSIYLNQTKTKWTMANIFLTPDTATVAEDAEALNQYPDCVRVGLLSPKNGGLIVRLDTDGDPMRTSFGAKNLENMMKTSAAPNELSRVATNLQPYEKDRVADWQGRLDYRCDTKPWERVIRRTTLALAA